MEIGGTSLSVSDRNLDGVKVFSADEMQVRVGVRLPCICVFEPLDQEPAAEYPTHT
jgi:hypothetical protein